MYIMDAWGMVWLCEVNLTTRFCLTDVVRHTGVSSTCTSVWSSLVRALGARAPLWPTSLLQDLWPPQLIPTQPRATTSAKDSQPDRGLLHSSGHAAESLQGFVSSSDSPDIGGLTGGCLLMKRSRFTFQKGTPQTPMAATNWKLWGENISALMDESGLGSGMSSLYSTQGNKRFRMWFN